jgi:rubrerythrin
MAKNRQDNLLNFLQCSSILEEKTSALYKKLADRVNLPLVSSLLLHIAYDSQKHSEILKGISESIDKSAKEPKGCAKKLGGIWATVSDLASEIAKEKRPMKETLPSLTKKLILLESAMAEEYYILVQVKTLKFMTKEIRELYNVNLEDIKDVLEIIINDEGTHRFLLTKIKKMLAGEEKETEGKAPAFKYNNPDAWSRAMPDSVYEGAL